MVKNPSCDGGHIVRSLHRELRSHMLQSNQACVLQLESMCCNERSHHDTVKILHAATKTQLNQINKCSFFKKKTAPAKVNKNELHFHSSK